MKQILARGGPRGEGRDPAERDPRRGSAGPRTRWSTRPRSTSSSRSPADASRWPGWPACTRPARGRPAPSTSTTCSSPRSASSTRRPTCSPATRIAGATSTSTSTRTRTGRSTCGSRRSPRSTATSPSSATTTSRIYGWRGADIRNILDFERDYPDADRRQARAELPEHPAHPRRRPRGRVAATRPGRTRSCGPRTPAGGSIRALRGLQRGRGGRVDRPPGRGAGRRPGLGPDPAGRRRATRRSRLRDIAVMYRMNAQSRAIEEAFLRYGIRYQLVGGTRFYQRREVKDALAYLRVLRSDTDVVSFERIINVPAAGDRRQDDRGAPRGRGPRRAHDVGGDRGRRRGRRTASRRSRRRPATADHRLRDPHPRLRARIGVLPLPELLDEVLERSGYRAMLADGTEEGEERWANLLELREVTTRYDDLSPEDALDRLLEETALVADQDTLRGRDRTPSRSSRSTRRRASSSRSCSSPGSRRASSRPAGRSTPSARCRPGPEPMEEERRLAYVGHHPGEAPAVPDPRLAARVPGDGPAARSRRASSSRSRPSSWRARCLVEGGGRGRPARPRPRVRAARRRGSIGGSGPAAAAFREGSGRPGAPPPATAFRPSRDLAAKREAFAAGAPSGSLGPTAAASRRWDDDGRMTTPTRRRAAAAIRRPPARPTPTRRGRPSGPADHPRRASLPRRRPRPPRPVRRRDRRDARSSPAPTRRSPSRSPTRRSGARRCWRASPASTWSADAGVSVTLRRHALTDARPRRPPGRRIRGSARS